MKTAVILGAGQMGQAARRLLNRNKIALAAFGDNSPQKWNREAVPPVLPLAEALALRPEIAIVGVLDEERSAQLTEQARKLGFEGAFLRMSDAAEQIDVRAATMRRISARLRAEEIPGALAELGVYRGDFAWQLNEEFPERKLYLFDTFEGFDARDVAAEREKSSSRAQTGDFADTGLQAVLGRMPHGEKIIVRRGYFPETAEGLEETFALVSLDADLYAPTLAGLRWFYPRMARGGMILLHDYNSSQFDGVRRAVKEYEDEAERLALVPLCDLHGTAVIVKP